MQENPQTLECLVENRRRGLRANRAERENIYTLGLIIILPDKTRLRSPSTKNSQTTHVNSHLSPLTPPARIVKNQSVQSIGGTEKYLGANRMIESKSNGMEYLLRGERRIRFRLWFFRANVNRQ